MKQTSYFKDLLLVDSEGRSFVNAKGERVAAPRAHNTPLRVEVAPRQYVSQLITAV
jgi:hypothetical protein